MLTQVSVTNSEIPLNSLSVADKTNRNKIITNDNAADDPLPLLRKPFFPLRYFMVLLCFTGFNCVYLLRNNLGVAIVAMINSTAHAPPAAATNNHHFNLSLDFFNKIQSFALAGQCPLQDLNTTQLRKKSKSTGEFNWDETTKGQILAAFYYGYACTQILGAYLAGRYGAYKIFGISILFTSLPTLLTEAAAHWSPWALFAVRFAEGAAEGFAFPTMTTFWTHWAPVHERTRLIGITYAGPELGAVFGSSIGGWLAQNYGWPSVFYVFGTCGCLWCVLWFVFAASRPRESRWISAYELKYIEQNLDRLDTVHGGQKKPPVPWGKFLTTPAVLAIGAAHFASHWNIVTFATYMPSYLFNVLKFSTAQSGLVTAVPYLTLMFVQILCGFLGDYLRMWWPPVGPRRTTHVRRLMNGIGAFGPCVFAALVPTAGCNLTAAVIILILALGLEGGCHAGYQVNHVDIASEYGGYLMGFTNTCGAIGAILVPIAAAAIAGKGSQQTIQSWSGFFYLSAAIFGVAGVIYCCFSSGERLPWLNDYIRAWTEKKDDEENGDEEENGRNFASQVSVATTVMTMDENDQAEKKSERRRRRSSHRLSTSEN